MNLSKKTIIYDLDDTLIDTSDLYWKVKSEIINEISNFLNISSCEIDTEFEKIETINSLKFGHIPERYELSTKDLCSYYKIKDDEKFSSIAKQIYLSHPEKIPYAEELLEWSTENFNISLMTRGIEKNQLEKLKVSGLDKYFSSDNIKVVESKDENIFRAFIKDLNSVPSDTWIIGDSINSDILPGLEANANVIHYNYNHDHYVWLQDKVTTEKDYLSVDSLEEVHQLLEKYK